MKKMIISLFAFLTMTVSANAMSYEQARNEALFLTDKMAYELNLTDLQYEAAYEINLDYLMSVTDHSDVFGLYWERRNMDIRHILYSWQWDAFCAATYFFRPLIWEGGYWHFGIYARYPRRDYFYFGRPHFYASYRGGHSWRMNGGRSYYEGRRDYFRPGHVERGSHFGMRSGWDRGDYRNQHHGSSSTRVTGPGRHDNNGGYRHDNNGGYRHDNNGGYRHDNNGGYRNDGRGSNSSSGHFEGRRGIDNRSGGSFEGRRGGSESHSGGSFEGRRSGSENRSFGGSRNSGSYNNSHSNGSYNNSHSSGSFGGRSSVGGSSVGSSSSSHSSGSFSGSSNRGSGSFSGSRSSGSHSSGGFSGGHSGGSHGGGATRGGGDSSRGSSRR